MRLGGDSIQPPRGRTIPVLIAHGRREFELPVAHEGLFFGSAKDHMSFAVLDAPEHGASLFRVSKIEERPEAVVVHVTDAIASTGPASSRGDPTAPKNGYPFP